MPTEPQGPLSIAVDALRTLLASSAAFQAWVGAADLEAAKARVHWFAVREPKALTRPYAEVSFIEADGLSGDVIGRGGHSAFGLSGSLRVCLTADAPDRPDEAGEDFRETILPFLNQVGTIVREMMQLAGGGGHLDVTAPKVTLGPALAREEDGADLPPFIYAELVFGYEDAWG